MFEHELKELLLKIEGHESLGQQEMRQVTILSAVNVATMMDMNAGVRLVDATSTTAKPEWAGDVVAYIELPTGEVSYFLPKDTTVYSNYTRQEKLERINKFMMGEEETELQPDDVHDGGILH